MLRNVDLNDISDGRLYEANDMVKADCRGCKGCYACCTGMGESIVLDPFDIYNLSKATNLDFASLMEKYIELNVVDGMTLPNIKMNPGCGFLNDEGRCTIHRYRPGICRLFPLGRVYDDEGFKYFIQSYECPVPNKGKVKVHKWIGIQNIKEYEKFIVSWHDFLKQCRLQLSELSEEQQHILSILIIRNFYQQRYNDFYEEYYNKLEETKNLLGLY